MGSVLFEDYDILEPAKCKQCGKVIFMIKGSHVTSSYTSGLTCHLQTHPVNFQEYLDRLKNTITPDNKTKFEHFQARNNQFSLREHLIQTSVLMNAIEILAKIPETVLA